MLPGAIKWEPNKKKQQMLKNTKIVGNKYITPLVVILLFINQFGIIRLGIKDWSKPAMES